MQKASGDAHLTVGCSSTRASGRRDSCWLEGRGAEAVETVGCTSSTSVAATECPPRRWAKCGACLRRVEGPARSKEAPARGALQPPSCDEDTGEATPRGTEARFRELTGTLQKGPRHVRYAHDGDGCHRCVVGTEGSFSLLPEPLSAAVRELMPEDSALPTVALMWCFSSSSLACASHPLPPLTHGSRSTRD